jgi:cytochrome c553
MKRPLVVAAGLALAAVSAIAAEPPAKPDAAAGQKIAAGVCAACHGADGNSAAFVNPNLAGQIPEYLYKQLVNFQAAPGKEPARKNAVMQAMVANLSPQDKRDLAAYFSLQTPKPGVAKNKNTIELGQRIYRAGIAERGVPACASCHGATGGGMPAQYPRLAGQWAEYTEAQMKAWRSGERANDQNAMMRTIAARMSDAEIAAVSDYIAGLR